MTWVDVADGSGFPIENLPYGSFSTDGSRARIGVAIGEDILDLRGVATSDLLPDELASLVTGSDLSAVLAAPATARASLRSAIRELLEDGHRGRDLARRHLVAQSAATMHLPFQVADYVDFYSSIEHATNLGRLMRPGQEPLLPNWRHLPVGYHGRSSTVVVSGTAIRRPRGQLKPADADSPVLEASRMLDFELEVGFVTCGPATELGSSIAVDDAEDHIFGLVLVNDWSARDIQAWEYQPLGPFLAKSFATSISPWVVPLDALEAYRIAAPAQEPRPLDYLREKRRRGIDLNLEVSLNGTTITHTSFRDMYWTMAQQLAHMTVNGSVVRPGDLYASGTVSGPERGSEGSLIELTRRGAEPLTLDDGSTRAFLEDGDTVVMRGWCGGDGRPTIGFGNVTGSVVASFS